MVRGHRCAGFGVNCLAFIVLDERVAIMGYRLMHLFFTAVQLKMI